jgi:hypothetical protein
MEHARSIQEVVRNLDVVRSHLIDGEICLIDNSIRQSIDVLTKDYLQLASELIGRLRQLKGGNL